MSGSDHHADDWIRTERRSFRMALAIALLPIPAALLASWLLGDPPWRPRLAPDAHQAAPVDTVPGRPKPETGRGHGPP